MAFEIHIVWLDFTLRKGDIISVSVFSDSSTEEVYNELTHTLKITLPVEDLTCDDYRIRIGEDYIEKNCHPYPFSMHGELGAVLVLNNKKVAPPSPAHHENSDLDWSSDFSSSSKPTPIRKRRYSPVWAPYSESEKLSLLYRSSKDSSSIGARYSTPDKFSYPKLDIYSVSKYNSIDVSFSEKQVDLNLF